MAAGLVAMAFTPATGAPLWLAVFGLGSGGIFALVMTLPLDLRDRPGDVGELIGWMLTLGYVISAVGPVLVGGLRDATDDFTAPLLALAAASAVAGALGLSPRLRPEGGRAHAHGGSPPTSAPG